MNDLWLVSLNLRLAVLPVEMLASAKFSYLLPEFPQRQFDCCQRPWTNSQCLVSIPGVSTFSKLPSIKKFQISSLLPFMNRNAEECNCSVISSKERH